MTPQHKMWFHFSQHHLLKRPTFLCYVLASFVKAKVPIDVWVYPWAFYLFPLIYISVSVTVPNYFSDQSLFLRLYSSDHHRRSQGNSPLPTCAPATPGVSSHCSATRIIPTRASDTSQDTVHTYWTMT